MKTNLSLRARLTLLILGPLIVIALLVGTWAYSDAQANAAERFDRSLLSTALAISRDIAVSGGDIPSQETRDLLRDTSGGGVFYHVYAPDGVFVTGYATPPISPTQVTSDVTQIYYDAVYQGAPVRALRFTQSTSIDGLTGQFTFTVWQNTTVRDGFVRTRTGPVFLIITSMIGALAIFVWFGVSRGLAPLIDLEDAIASRSAADLTPIKRSIPTEVTGIVGRFNDLVGELSRTLDAKNAFISDAAHQLRNPIAGVLSLAESVNSAKSFKTAKERSEDLLEAAREAGQLANNLLTLERAQAPRPHDEVDDFDPAPILNDLVQKAHILAQKNGIGFTVHRLDSDVRLKGDPIMFGQAILNLITNAILHGGPTLSEVYLNSRTVDGHFEVTVLDDGKGISPKDFGSALGRFSQIGPSAGSGLGLPIAAAVADAMGGTIKPLHNDKQFGVRLTIPQKTMAGGAW